MAPYNRARGAARSAQIRIGGTALFAPLKFLYLTQKQVHDLRPRYGEIAKLVEDSLRDKANGNADMPSKIAVHPRKGQFVHAKPGYLGGMDLAGIKWQSNIATNPKRDLPNNIGVMILTEPDNGATRAIMDCSWITGFRTPAASMVAIAHLAPSGASVVAIVGLGMQGQGHLDALLETRAVKRLKTIKVFDLSKERTAGFARDAAKKTKAEVVRCGTAEEAVRGSDIVISCTALYEHPKGVVRAEWLEPGVLALPVDIGCYWTPQSRRSMDRIFTDDVEQTQSFAKRRFFEEKKVRLDAELGDVIAGKTKGRRSQREKIMCINCGLSLYDIALAERIYERARARKIGRWLPW